MKDHAIRKTIAGEMNEIIERVTEAIKPAGFGVLTRIDFDQKMKEKLGESVPRTVILGACHPRLAYEAYKKNTDVTMLVPCNIVVREVGPGKFAVEAIRPSAMLSFLPAIGTLDDLLKVENDLSEAIDRL